MISELEMHEDMLEPLRGGCRCPEWSTGYDTCPDALIVRDWGFDSWLRHRIFADRWLSLIQPTVADP